MPIKQAEMKAIADAAAALRDLYVNDLTLLGLHRTMWAESGDAVHLEALLETLDRLCYSASGATAQHMVCVEVYLERYRLTSSANAANAERKRRARARVMLAGGTRHQVAVKEALQVLDATSQGDLTDEEWAALQEFNTSTGFGASASGAHGYKVGRETREGSTGTGEEFALPQPPAPGMGEVDLGGAGADEEDGL